MVIKQRESSKCMVERRLTQRREGRTVEAELHPILMSLGAVGFAGICKALLMVLFTVAFLLLFIHVITHPISFGSWCYGKSLYWEGGLLRSAYSGKLSLLEMDFASCPGEKEKTLQCVQVERLFNPSLLGLWRVCIGRFELRTGVCFLLPYSCSEEWGNV